MRLKEYLKNNGIRSGWLAKKVPCSGVYMSCIVSGKVKPSLIIRRRIEALTNGAVTEHDFEVDNTKDKNE